VLDKHIMIKTTDRYVGNIRIDKVRPDVRWREERIALNTAQLPCAIFIKWQ